VENRCADCGAIATHERVFCLEHSEPTAFTQAVGGGGHPNKFCVTFEDGSQAIVKPAVHGDPNTQRMASNEVAAWIVAAALGWNDLVAETVLRSIPGPDGLVVEASVQVMWSSDPEHHTQVVPPVSSFSEREALRAAAFDVLIGQQDRSGNNWIGTTDSNGSMQLRLVDNGHAFGYPQEGVAVQSAWTDAHRGQSLPSGIVDALVVLQTANIRPRLEELLGEDEVKRFYERLESMIAQRAIA
jgi:hypothetical protein